VFLFIIFIAVRKNNNKPIPYDKLTYGKIHNIVVDVGIQISTEFKIQNKLRKFGIEPIRAPSIKKKKIIKKHNKAETKTYKKLYIKKYNKPPLDNKPPRKPK